ncbi:lipopolysaccharide-induced tumor necrosis factor-alpha factor homolog [Schistocerca gregaria]|uniref:lipopolysaccharide-induced tumor necrosis factor-alpha factor homolog n=1 Tax=Schistocerca gregaria TaxID=7010 RepID=UPI00211EE014|nr:lipopolysaccharide-induced tumor necrosis factor-alpha factor homolog [Schistocerca gregaria]
MEPNKSQPPPYGFQPPPTQPPPYTQTPQGQPYGPPPPQPGYVQQHITVVAPLLLGTDPCTTECPACRATIVTRTSSKPSTNTHLLALLLCIFGLWPCVCVPYCAECAYAVDHFCPNCNAYIGQSMA